jgi:hypothetical protein
MLGLLLGSELVPKPVLEHDEVVQGHGDVAERLGCARDDTIIYRYPTSAGPRASARRVPHPGTRPAAHARCAMPAAQLLRARGRKMMRKRSGRREMKPRRGELAAEPDEDPGGTLPPNWKETALRAASVSTSTHVTPAFFTIIKFCQLRIMH